MLTKRERLILQLASDLDRSLPRIKDDFVRATIRDLTTLLLCRMAGYQQCHQCPDMECGDNLRRVEK